MLTWALLRTGGGDRRDLGERLGFLAALAASTLAVLFYTVFAVDFLDQAYIIYFYRAVPGLLTAVTVCALNTATDIRWHGRLALAAVLSERCFSHSVPGAHPTASPAFRKRTAHWSSSNPVPPCWTWTTPGTG